MNYIYPKEGEENEYEYVVSDLTLDRYAPTPNDGTDTPLLPLFRIRQRPISWCKITAMVVRTWRPVLIFR